MGVLDCKQPGGNLGGLLWSFGISGALVLSYSLPESHTFWVALDTYVAYALNSLVYANHSAQLLWAFASLRLSDYIAGVILLMVVVHYVIAGNNASLTVRFARMIVTCVVLVALVGLTRQLLFHDVARDSPSLVLKPFTLLSEHTSFEVKDHSARSFPGDHATVLATFTFLLWYFAGRRYGLVGAMLAILFALPRLVSGAHWLSDVVIGGVVTALATVALIVFTPCGHYLVNAVLRATLTCLYSHTIRR